MIECYSDKAKYTIDYENEQRKEIMRLKRQDHYDNYQVSNISKSQN